MRRIFMLAIVAIMVMACDKADFNPGVRGQRVLSGDYISYGTSFGMCLGYCIRSVKITSSKIVFEKSGHDMSGALEPVKKEEANTLNLEELYGKFDYSGFEKLDEVIGCPDCADGGAEWIEISVNGQVKKVTFEYHHEPEEVKGVIEDLRTLLAQME